jgi:molecular chaperone GrpE (heat shock protein)
MTDRFDEILAEMRSDHFALERRSGEIVLQDVLRASREERKEIRQSIRESKERTAQIKADTAEIKRRTAENTEASKAHTRAIFALIDRLERGSGPLSRAT